MVKKLGKLELFAPGHRGCAGCGQAIAARLLGKALGKNIVIINATGCLEVMSSTYPLTAWRVPWFHVAFENAAAAASGVEAAIKAQIRKGRRPTAEKIHIIGLAGDGGTFDIGLQSLSGAMERGHDMLYICLDNEAYMNTGTQRSSSTTYGAWTSTTPIGKFSIGENRQKKNLPAIAAAHNIPYVATACIAYPLDLINKLTKGAEVNGPAYVQVLTPCPTGWRFDPELTVEIGRLAVQTGYYPLYEIENGKLNVTVKVSQRKPVIEFLKLQGRFRHLKGKEVDTIQSRVYGQCKQLGIS